MQVKNNVEIKNFYPKKLNYHSIRKSLKNGITKNESAVIKNFECSCEKHANLCIYALVPEEKNTITFNECEFNAGDENVLAVNSEGKLLLSAYQFYFKHPNWKVRVAIAIGLCKLNKREEQEIVNILSLMLKDKHWHVRLAAVQALSEIKYQAFNKLENPKLEKFYQRATMRHKVGINLFKINAATLYKLLDTAHVRKIYHSKPKTNKLLITNKIYHRLNMDKIRKRIAHDDNLSPAYKRPFMYLSLPQGNILVRNQRYNKKLKYKAKINYLNALFYKQVLPIEGFKKITNPNVGEIYWARADHDDPKISRPLLIVKVVNREAGDYLTVSLTSDTTLQNNENLTIEINGKKSTVQLFRKKIINQSILMSKYGKINKEDLQGIVDRLPEIKPKAKVTSKRPHRYRKFYRPRKKQTDKYLIIEDIPSTNNVEPKVSMRRPLLRNTFFPQFAIKRREIVLADFIKPEDRLLLNGRGPTSQLK